MAGLLLGDAAIAWRAGVGVGARAAHLLRRATGDSHVILDLSASGGLASVHRRLPHTIGCVRGLDLAWGLLVVGAEDAASDPALVEWLDVVEAVIHGLVDLGRVRRIGVLLPEPGPAAPRAAARWLGRVAGPLEQRIGDGWVPQAVRMVRRGQVHEQRVAAETVSGAVQDLLATRAG